VSAPLPPSLARQVFGAAPFAIDGSTPVCDRVNLMLAMAAQGQHDPSLIALAAEVQRNANRLCDAVRAGAAHDPAWADALRTQWGCARVLACECLLAAQSVPYVAGPSGVDQYQPVAWTLAHGGECKAKAVLFAALARRLGLDAWPEWITQDGQPLNHAVGVVRLDPPRPMWADGSIRGAALGESPYEALTHADDAHAVTGLARRDRSAPDRGGRPFQWEGWHTLWRGWPASWWCRNYPTLCDPSRAPSRYAFLTHAVGTPIAPAGCGCIHRPVSDWGVGVDPEDVPAIVNHPVGPRTAADAYFT
jgi:hypothetical protein